MNPKTQYFLNLLLAASFLAVLVTGIIKFPGLLKGLGAGTAAIPWALVSGVHHWAGAAMIVLGLVHAWLHMGYAVAMAKQVLGKK